MDTFTIIRVWIVTTFNSILAFLTPIAGDLASMLLLFMFNALFGLIADITNGGSWSAKKLWKAFKEAGLFFCIVFFIYGIGHLKAQMEGAQQCVSFVVYSLIYFYGTNIARNAVNITPDGSIAHKACKFLYYIISVEFIKKVPYLAEYIENRKEKK